MPIWRIIKFFFFLFYLIISNPRVLFRNSKARGLALSSVLQGLGPAFVKFAQLLSTRPDIVGDKLALDLQILQDNMPQFSRKFIDEVFLKIYQKLPNEIFTDFNYSALAAASMAQVHKAVMFNGKTCAVKILRPNIRKNIEKNIELLFSIVAWIDEKFESYRRFRLPEIILMLKRNLAHETDLTFEGASASQIKLNLEKDPDVYIPEIYWSLTRTDVLVMEWIDAVPLNKIDRLNLTTSDRRVILRNLVNTFCNQAYRDGVFHADMHPGNIFIDSNYRIILTDFGIVGRMDKKTKFYITEILRGFLKKDYKSVAHIHFEAGYVDGKYNIAEFENACRAIGNQIVGKNLSDISVGALFSALLKLTNDFQMSTRLELLLIQKATVLLEGVSSTVDNNINIWQLSDVWLHDHYMTWHRILKMRVRGFYKEVKEELREFWLF